jgi:hypothetical protein
MVNLYLVFAYGLAWGIFVIYAWVLSGRERKLEREVEDLKRAISPK